MYIYKQTNIIQIIEYIVPNIGIQPRTEYTSEPELFKRI